MTSTPVPASRADRFIRELAELKIPDPAAARTALWRRLGGLLMTAGLVLGALAFPLAHATDDSLAQGDALALGLGGVTAAVVGGALFLRYSLTDFLRFWLARQSYDLDRLGERLSDPAVAAKTVNSPAPEGEPSNGAAPSPR
ncbi:hypothetical protein [Streptomyces sp. GbtcB6]|uniref:hypothetical protein n=1 Tax=Streptomyces sp. GbtcB6 TaxID=2824751 RepID=UPI001C2F62E5|nr:hypothetical protein [Streptomyces sp. GbtcB6]